MGRIKMVETEKRKFKIKGKEVSRGEFIKSKRQEKKAKVRAFRNEHGIPEPEKKTFDLNNEKVWFKNTWKQVKVQLMNKFVKRMRSFRITLKKLEETDISALDDAKRKTIELKMRRCTNGEKLMEKEMYLIKGWHHQDIFNMLIDTPEMAFTAAVAITDKTGDMTPRARERVRAHPLIEPKEEEKTSNKEVNRFSLDKFESLKKKTEVKESDDRVRDESEEEKEADVAETKEVEEFNEYSSEDDGEDNDSDQEPATPAENDDDDNGYDIEFVMPKFLQKETHKAESPSNSKSNSNDFFIENEADKYAQSGDEDDEKDEDNIKEDQNDKDGFFLGADGNTAMALKRQNVKSKTSKTRALNQSKDNRLGQRERKQMTKSVYGKHTQEVEKQEKKFRERKTKRKGEKETEKDAASKEEHPSWQARKKAKAESTIKAFEGTKVRFDDSD